MSDQIEVEGKVYISSRRASESTGYAQDYIGQLARKGLIDSRRIGGLWYVSLESLVNYKTKAESYVPTPPISRVDQNADSVVTLDGRNYLSASRAAEKTGYHPDYVGQLAREGKVLSRQIGTRWYVDRDEILEHKREKDALLAAVQAEAVGLAKPVSEEKVAKVPADSDMYRYTSEEKDLFSLFESEEELPQEQEEEHAIPIRVIEAVDREQRVEPRIVEKRTKRSSGRKFRPSIPTLVGVFAAILVVTIGYVSYQKSSIYARSGVFSEGLLAQGEKVGGFFSGFTAILERIIVPEIVYRREPLNFDL